MLAVANGSLQPSLCFTIRWSLFDLFSLSEIIFNWFRFKWEKNVNAWFVIIPLWHSCAQETHIVTTCVPHAIFVKICFLCQSVLELHMKIHVAPMYYFCTSCLECGKLFIWIVMWTNLLNELCTLVILLIDLHV